ncbi:hypothetical protein OVS_03160 [Mycoplasma ovis str. Michigan]|uniref:Uncharacterized protein n=1 Tax=Mycoplasma ovis str. Michigan TaxID=1415773 RepID=A0ABM5P241_9MOLU|nr:hypothetical protein [Mycoplasma ovis]AHC40385.1 hypothetical protein OVS_03160 [Mycoplasma ovis str. Michigan]
MKKCEDNSKLTVKLTDGSTKTVNKEGLMKLIKENEKTPDLKEIEWPEGCEWETQSSSES